MDNLIEQAQWMLAVTQDPRQDLSQALLADLLRRKPAPAEWSAVECLQHLIDAERVFQYRVKCFMKGTDFPAFNPDQEGILPGERSPVELAREL